MNARYERDKLLRMIRDEEIGVLVCAPGSTPQLKMDIVLQECGLCHQVVHMDANNVELASHLVPICGPCFMAELWSSDFDHRESGALVGGVRMTFQEGMEAVAEMVKPTDDPN
jgi:hypothetical protein